MGGKGDALLVNVGNDLLNLVALLLADVVAQQRHPDFAVSGPFGSHDLQNFSGPGEVAVRHQILRQLYAVLQLGLAGEPGIQ